MCVHARGQLCCSFLIIRLLQGIDNGPQTPPAGKLFLQLDPIYEEAIEGVASKLGRYTSFTLACYNGHVNKFKFLKAEYY